MDTTLSISQVRSELPQLVKNIDISQVLITVKGKIKAALIDAEEYQNMQETLDILSDTKTMENIAASLADIQAGRVVEWKKVRSKYVSGKTD